MLERTKIGSCNGRDGYGCKDFCPLWAQDLRESRVILV